MSDKSNSRFLTKNSLSILMIFTISISVSLKKNKIHLPIPTEIIEKKKNRKNFKQHRREWMENMHRVSPDKDYKILNDRIRKEKHSISTFNRINRIQNIESNRNPLPVPGEWFERGSNNQAGRILTSFYDSENLEVYCASSGGNIWRGDINGNEWTSLNDYFQIKGIHFLDRFNYSNTTRMIMINDKGCFRTDNEGYVIELANGLESVENWGWIFRALRADNDLESIFLAAIEWDYDEWTYMPSIYKSNDNGESFSRILELTENNGFIIGTSHFDIWTSSLLGGDLIILNNGMIYRLDSITNEITFISEIETEEIGNNIIIGGETDDGQFFLHVRIGDRLYTSIDSGSSWQDLGTLPTGTFTINSFECSSIDPNLISIGNVDGYKTNDGGQNWELINHWWEYYSYPESKLHADIPEISYVIDEQTNDEFQLISTDGGIYKSYDHLVNVLNISLDGLGVSQYYSTYTKKHQPHHIYAGSQDQGFQRYLSSGSYDGVLDFEQTISGDYGHIVSKDGGNSLWTDYPGFVMYYPDIANSTEMHSWDFQGEGYLWLPPLMNDPNSANMVYIGGGGIYSQNHIVKVTYTANGMVAEDLEYTFPSKISALSYSPIISNKWYVSTENGEFFYSDNAGASFTQTSSFSGPSSHYFYGSSILPSPVNEDRIYIGGSGYSNPAVYLSENGGQSFIAFDDGLPNTLVYDLASLPDESVLFAATEVGPYAFSFETEIWESIAGTDAPEQVYWSVEYIDEIQTVRFGTYGRGIWDFTFNHNPLIDIGDLNQDQAIDLDDLLTLIGIILSDQEIGSQIISIADINFDDTLNIFDIILLIDMIS